MKKSEDIERNGRVHKYSRLRAIFLVWITVAWACQLLWGLDAGKAVAQFVLDNWQITDGLPANNDGIWFYALCFLVLIALLILGHLLRVRHLKKRAVRLQAIVNERTRELNVQNKKLEQAAVTDPLTGLYNRRKMWEMLRSESLRYERNAKPFSLILGDIDHFKTFNDQYGHDCGDFILVRIAALLRSAVREQDAVSRWGGEEFLLLLPETGRYGGGVLTEKIRRQIADSSFEYNGNRLVVTMTFGLAVYQENMDVDLCLKRADEALLKGKQQGRNCWVALD